MLLTEKELKDIIKEGVCQLMESRLASNILASEKVMDALSKSYYSMYISGMPEHEIKKDMVYFLEQNCGVCERPTAISKALGEIWDKIQMGAQKYGYKGPVLPVQKEGIPEYIKERAARLAANKKLMHNLGSSYYWGKRNGRLAWELNKDNPYGLVNTLINYPEYRKVVGYLRFNEAKMIIKYLTKELKQYAKEYEKEVMAMEAEKNSVSEAVYNDVINKLLNG